MSDSNWKLISWSECPRCGSEPEVLSKSELKDCVHDDEEARCSSCYHPGITSVDDDGARIVWLEDGDNDYFKQWKELDNLRSQLAQLRKELEEKDEKNWDLLDKVAGMHSHQCEEHKAISIGACTVCLVDEYATLQAAVAKLTKSCSKLQAANIQFVFENDELQAALEKERWIPVEERLPKEHGDYLVIRTQSSALDNCDWEQSYYLPNVPENGGKHGWSRGYPVTHWKEITLPEEEISGCRGREK